MQLEQTLKEQIELKVAREFYDSKPGKFCRKLELAGLIGCLSLVHSGNKDLAGLGAISGIITAGSATVSELYIKYKADEEYKKSVISRVVEYDVTQNLISTNSK